jgi:hypothetical protein
MSNLDRSSRYTRIRRYLLT